jgi:hypothetical protein
VAVGPLPVDGQALLLAIQRLLILALPLVDEAEVTQAGGLAPAVAQLSEDGEALLQAGQRLGVPALPQEADTQVVVGLCLGSPVAHPASNPEGGLVDPYPILPIAVH